MLAIWYNGWGQVITDWQFSGLEMSNSSNIQQSKRILNKAAHSLVLGIISIVLPYLIVIWQGTGVHSGSALVFVIGIAIAFMCAIVGLSFGIQGLKSTRRKLAIVGIAACAIGLLLWAWGLLGWLMMGGPIYL